MRLINTTSLILAEFQEETAPVYAILSHTWGTREEEVTFQQMTNRTPAVEAKSGYAKIRRFCEVASSKYMVDWAWVDTCCIDKSSSAELSEAINSMYRWYEKASVCVTFLADYPSHVEVFTESAWFTRGWTLQELISPRQLEFWDSHWQLLGTKFDLVDQLATRTGIPSSILRKEKEVSEIPVAERMYWVSSRQITRGEDIAYCLLGIFDINMPMLYGEGGTKAFLRLQEEIIKQDTDMSIFAWTAHVTSEIDEDFSGLLATSPKCFSACKDFVTSPFDARLNMRGFSISNRGIQFNLYLGTNRMTGCSTLPLHYDSPLGINLGVYLRPVAPDLFVRAYPYLLASVGDLNREFTFHVTKVLSQSQSLKISRTALKFPELGFPDSIAGHDFPFALLEACPPGFWNPAQQVIYAGHTGTFRGILIFSGSPSEQQDERFVVACDYQGNDWSVNLSHFVKEDIPSGGHTYPMGGRGKRSGDTRQNHLGRNLGNSMDLMGRSPFHVGSRQERSCPLGWRGEKGLG